MSHPRSKFLKGSLILFVAVMGLFMAAAWMAGRNRPELPQVILKDGRIVQLAAVTVGPEHKQHSPTFRNILFRFMPDGIRRQIGPAFNSSFGFQYNGIALWLMCYDPGLRQYVPGAIDRIVVVDPHGCELESTGSGFTSDGVHQASVINLSNFPRDLDQLTCQLFAPSSSNALGQIIITNPLKTASVHWSPSPLPLTIIHGDIAVRLDQLPRTSSPKVVVFQNGQPTKEWSLQMFYFEDAFGNAGPNLCRKQSAWKFKTRFSRNEAASFSGDELLRLPPVKLPPPGVCFTLNWTNQIGTNEVIARHIVGPGSYMFSNMVFISGTPWTNGMGGQFGVTSMRGPLKNYLPVTIRAQDETTLIISHPPLDGLREMLIRARFEDRLVAVSRTGNRDGTATYFDLNWLPIPSKIPPTNAPIDIEVIIQEAREFDFIVAPDEAIQTSGLSP